jgi:hypothetical protein
MALTVHLHGLLSIAAVRPRLLATGLYFCGQDVRGSGAGNSGGPAGGSGSNSNGAGSSRQDGRGDGAGAGAGAGAGGGGPSIRVLQHDNAEDKHGDRVGGWISWQRRMMSGCEEVVDW